MTARFAVYREEQISATEHTRTLVGESGHYRAAIELADKQVGPFTVGIVVDRDGLPKKFISDERKEWGRK